MTSTSVHYQKLSLPLVHLAKANETAIGLAVLLEVGLILEIDFLDCSLR